MINSHTTGAIIARKRREHDWTQLELADRLHVTPQAVSRWETGDPFPDLVTLVQLSEVIKISVDELLANRRTPANATSSQTSLRELVAGLARGEPETVSRIIIENPQQVEALIETAPLTKPSMLRKVVNAMGNFEFTNEQILQLAPFVDEDVMETFIESEAGETGDRKFFRGLLPFLSETAIEKFLDRILAGEITGVRPGNLAPFLGEAL